MSCMWCCQNVHTPCNLTRMRALIPVRCASCVQVEVFRLANLPDLDQSNSFVCSTLKSWVVTVVKNYSFDGLWCDTTPEVYGAIDHLFVASLVILLLFNKLHSYP